MRLTMAIISVASAANSWRPSRSGAALTLRPRRREQRRGRWPLPDRYGDRLRVGVTGAWLADHQVLTDPGRSRVTRAAGPCRHRGLDLGGHHAEVEQRLVGVRAAAEVDLGDRVEPVLTVDVEQRGHLHAVAGGHRQRREHLAPHGPLAGQRLHDAAQRGRLQGQQRTRDELGDPAALVGGRGLAVAERALVEALDQQHRRVVEQGAEQTRHEVGVPVDEVGVHEDQQVAGGDEQRLPHRLALAAGGPEVGPDLGGAVHHGSGAGGHVEGGVVGVAVDDHDLVEQRGGLHERLAHLADHDPDGGRLVAGRHHQADGEAGGGLDGQQLLERPLAPVVGAAGEPGVGLLLHLPRRLLLRLLLRALRPRLVHVPEATDPPLRVERVVSDGSPRPGGTPSSSTRRPRRSAVPTPSAPRPGRRCGRGRRPGRGRRRSSARSGS